MPSRSEGPAEVRAEGWGWRHAGRRAFAVRGLDLLVQPGERVLLLGPSGAGKSTLLLGLAGLLGGEHEGEAEGSLLVDGRPAREARRRSGLVLQDPDSQVVLARCGDDVAFGLENLAVPPAEIWPRVDAALHAVGFPYGRAHPTSALSGGERQRLVVAGVLAMRPGLLLLDEPTANLDPAGAALVRETVARATADRRTTLVVVEHRIAEWLGLVDRVVVLAPGGGVAVSGPTELVEHHRELAEAGVWVPAALPTSRRPARAPGPELLTAGALDAGPTQLPVVRDVTLALAAGRCTAVTGPNGAGKSSLALTLAGLLRPLAGTVVAAPQLAGGLGPSPHRWRARDLVRRIGTVFQDPEHQFLTGSVEAELRHGPTLLRLPDTDARVRDLLDRLHLTALARANPYTLSGGEKRRLSVGTAIATAPRVLVLDEPTFGQDPRTWHEIVGLLEGLLDGGACVVTATHDEHLVTRLADEVLELNLAREAVPA